MFANTMPTWDTVSASMAECYITIDGRRYSFANAISLKAKVEKVKVEVPILGRLTKGQKATGWKGTGNATFHFNASTLRMVMMKYMETGIDTYFSILVANEDPTSKVGRQEVILTDCNLNSMDLAAFDASGEILEEECDFTFEGSEMPRQFKPLPLG